MWLLTGASNTKENIRIALFSSYDKAKDYLDSYTDHIEGNIRIFKENSPLAAFVFVKIEFEDVLPLDPI